MGGKASRPRPLCANNYFFASFTLFSVLVLSYNTTTNRFSVSRISIRYLTIILLNGRKTSVTTLNKCQVVHAFFFLWPAKQDTREKQGRMVVFETSLALCSGSSLGLANNGVCHQLQTLFKALLAKISLQLIQTKRTRSV